MADEQELHVVLLGDSTLDNLIWVGDRVQECVVGELRARLAARTPQQQHGAAAGSRVTSFAADGFTTADVLHGAEPVLSRAAWARVGEPFPLSAPDGGAALRPLACLAELHGRQAVSHVVLSVGGNDIRVVLGAMHRLPGAIAALQENYRAIVAEALRTCPRLVLVLQYRPCLQMDAEFYGVYQAMAAAPGEGDGAAKLAQLMGVIFAPVLALARAERLPVVDLPNSMDPSDASLFSHQIEPSAAGSAFIAGMLADVLGSHDFAGPSRIYSRDSGKAAGPGAGTGDGELQVGENGGVGGGTGWRVRSVAEGGVGGGGGGGGGGGDGAGGDAAANAAEAQRQRQVRAGGGQVMGAAPLPEAVAHLVAMGFEEDRARAALALCGNLPAAALDRLLAE